MAIIGIIKDKNITYDCEAPFHPSQKYPEYPFKQISPQNSIYSAVRGLFGQMQMDSGHFNSPSWNPLEKIVTPGNTVILKPNFVRHYNPIGDLDCLFTHGSVIRAILDYVFIALKGEGKIIIGDAPLQNCDFDKLIEFAGIDKIISFYNQQSSVKLELMDFRLAGSIKYKSGFIFRKDLNGDPSGYLAVDLKMDSELFAISRDFEKYRVTNYDKCEMVKHHNREKNEYLIPKTVLEADVIINIPKLKTHRKAGITCALKNLVGINGCKDWLPHHRFGSTEEGGDEYLYRSFRKNIATVLYEKKDVLKNRYAAMVLMFLIRAIEISARIVPYKDPYREGSWYGNDTLPRTIADLNRIAMYADKQGRLHNAIQRKNFILVDAVIAGEKEGPMDPSPKHCGLMVAGLNPVLVDLICSTIMGFDYNKIAQFKYALKEGKQMLLQERPENIVSGAYTYQSLNDIYKAFGEQFTPTKGWVGYIER